ncbi:hypothetical protein NQ314_011443 [Rhamnusium bicolor]|uniref:Fanconi anemia group I protein n=1 Tax=Rhamnusium bicolor TaxID=1586634 RepID=A0AAV8XJ61_9CUCU|nr:hypothetical protein NQ314_011443 [Rhamnusium bicolor]
MASVEEKIHEYGQKRDANALQQIMTTLDDDEASNYINNRTRRERCTGFSKKYDSQSTFWKDLMPELLNVLIERETFEYNDFEYTGVEYKTEFINTLCMSPWSPNIVTSLTAMFIDMPLMKEEHLKIVNKLGTYIEKMTSQEIPAFVYQLLRLCKQQNGRSIFLKLQSYFGLRIYNNRNFNSDSSSDSNVNDFDAIESTSNQEMIEAESTVLYHIHTAASLGHGCIKDYLTSLKNMLKSPEFVLNSFQLMVLFTISTIPHYEETVFDIVRPCIVRSYNEEQRKLNSFCLERELVLQALVNFGFVLLGVGSGLGRDPIAEKQWNLGNMILLKIIKRKRHIAQTVIQTLSNHIVTGQSVSQYIECLYILSKTLPLLMLENQSCIVELMESLVQVPGNVANQLLDALIPITRVSPTIRDHLIILLRKALYSRVTETRQMAVNGFLKLLTNLKVSNLVALSQSSSSTGSFSSGHSLFTQISMNRTTQTVGTSTFSNEALCLEVLSILKRCFMQQLEVRSQLYEGLYDAVCMNSGLGIPVLDLIWFHFSEYYFMDEDLLPPLNFSKIAVCREMESVLLDDGTDLLDIVPESQQKMHTLKEAMSVYEALIGYKICSWDLESENSGQMVNSLFQGYNRLLHFSKPMQKTKKMDNDKSTQQTQANTTLKKDKSKSAKQMRVPETVLNFQTIKKILNLLHEPNVDWSTTAQAVMVKSKREFHQHIMQATIHLVHNVKRHKDIESRYKKLSYDHITDVALVLFSRIVKRLNEFINFDSTTAVLAMDCFHAILVLITSQYKSNMKIFMNKVVGDGNDVGFVVQLTTLVKIYQKIFEMTEEEVNDDIEIKKMSLIIINTLSVLANQIPSDSNPLSIQMCEWLKNFTYNNTVSNKVSSTFINLLFETHIKYKISLTLFEQISASIGNAVGVIREDEDNAETFTIINEGTVQSISLSLCSNIKSILEDIEAVIARLKSEYNILVYPGAENIEKKKENLKTKERGVCCQICFVVTILTNLSNLAIDPGNMSEAIFKNIMHLFCTLSLLTKHFIMRSSKVNLVFQGARFERLVKLAGKQLAPAVNKFVTVCQDRQTRATQEKKKKVDSGALKSKVLRENRIIPKVVYEMEQFSKCVIQLSNKTKVDLAKHVGQGIARDFRIKELKEVLEQAGENTVAYTQSTDSTNVSREETEADDQEINGDIDEEEEIGSPPPSKKSKK